MSARSDVKMQEQLEGILWNFMLHNCTHNWGAILVLINPLKTKLICFTQRLSALSAVSTLHFGYKNQPLNVL
jgi:hypothetical protein